MNGTWSNVAVGASNGGHGLRGARVVQELGKAKISNMGLQVPFAWTRGTQSLPLLFLLCYPPSDVVIFHVIASFSFLLLIMYTVTATTSLIKYEHNLIFETQTEKINLNLRNQT